ncbi:hypothetical protein HK104_003112 [Borealophlyctis nickersoniae]|nr:hypothetical protein HK104_003112 [Borealophlyctis nickersoniae]
MQGAVQLDPHWGDKDGLSTNRPPYALPHFNKNRRRNTSAVVRYMHSDGRERTILIDCGKTFYEAALTWFTEYRLRKIDAVLLTHGHADALLGMDDLRQWTIGLNAHRVQEYIDIYCSPETLQVVERTFPYMVDKRHATGGGDVASLRFHVFGEGGFKPFMIEELEVIPFEVEHGKIGAKPFMSLGYRFGDLTYISDVNAIPDPAKEIIKGTKTLILDVLHDKPHPSHFSVPESIAACIELLEPGSRAFLTGLAHRLEHEAFEKELEENEDLKRAGIVARVAYDGLRILYGEQ